MKLAEALQERADLNRAIEQLHSRLDNNTLVQEGETPAESPSDLKRELDSSLERLAYLIARINITNCQTDMRRSVADRAYREKGRAYSQNQRVPRYSLDREPARLPRAKHRNQDKADNFGRRLAE